MKTFLSMSGGKDSVASFLICQEKGILLDGVLYSEVMFDSDRGISAVRPDMLHFLHDRLFPYIESCGVPVIVLRAEGRKEIDYMSFFHKKRLSSGLKYGFPLGSYCALKKLKTIPIHRFFFFFK